MAALDQLSHLPLELSIAESIEQRECLRQSGFYVPFDAVPRSQSGSFSGIEVTTNEQLREIMGYRTTFKPNMKHPWDRFQDELPTSRRDRFQRAQYGDEKNVVRWVSPKGQVIETSATGCVAQGRIAVYGTVLDSLRVSNFVNVVNEQGREYFRDLRNAEGQAAKTYVPCMAERGYKTSGVRDTEDLAGKLFGQYRNYGDPPSAREKALAKADFECQQKAGLYQKLRDVVEHKGGKWLIELQGEILSIKEVVDASKVRATTIIKSK